MVKGFGVCRSRTPADRHQRVNRHRPYVQCRKYSAPAKEIQEITEQIPLQEDHTVSKVPAKEEKAAKTKKQLKREEKEALLALQAQQPHSCFLQLIFDPIGSVRRSCESIFVEYTMLGCMLASLFKWVLIGGLAASVIGMRINAHAYSYAYLSFSSLAALAMKFGAAGFGCETAVLICTGLVSKLSGRGIGFAALYDTHTHALPCVILLTMLCGLLLYMVPAVSFGAAVIPVIAGALLDGYMLVRYDGRISMPAVAYTVSFALACAAYMYGYREITAPLSYITRLFGV